MFLNIKRLLLTLYRLEEGQQEIMERLERLVNPPGDKAATPLYKRGCDASPARGGGPEGDGGVDDKDSDKWIIDGIEAILSYRRNSKEETI